MDGPLLNSINKTSSKALVHQCFEGFFLRILVLSLSTTKSYRIMGIRDDRIKKICYPIVKVLLIMQQINDEKCYLIRFELLNI